MISHNLQFVVNNWQDVKNSLGNGLSCLVFPEVGGTIGGFFVWSDSHVNINIYYLNSIHIIP